MGADLAIVAPEILLAVYAMAALMFGVFGGKDSAASTLLWTTSAVFAALALWIGFAGEGSRSAFGGMIVDDPFSRFGKVAILLSAAAVLTMSEAYMARRGLLRFEYPLLIALAAVGMMVMVSAGDLIALYMGLELQSLALYVAASLRRDGAKSTEAGLKYFVLGALSSGLLLYGASLTYGFAGTTLFSGIVGTVQAGQAPLGLLFGIAFLFAGFAFKVSAAPFHMWTPDVYEGAPTPVTAFFATAPKLAAMLMFARVAHDAFGPLARDWGQIVAFLAAASMLIGAVAAVGQRDIKRLMAYSSISHMGFALMGLAPGGAFGVQAMLVYLAIYVVTSLGTFAFILSMERDGQPATDIAALKQYARSKPLKALAVLALMFSLAGVPPLAGFFGKLYVLRAAVDGGMAWLAAPWTIATVVGAFYYLRIVYYMYFGEENEAIDSDMSPAAWLTLIASAGLVTFGAFNLFGVEVLAEAAAAVLAN